MREYLGAPSKETMEVHWTARIASCPGELPPITRPTPAESDLVRQNIIKHDVSVKQAEEIQEVQERWRLNFMTNDSMQ